MFKGKIGCEIELIIERRKVLQLRDMCEETGWVFGGDGSIHCNDSSYETAEIKSKVYKIEEIPEMLEFVKKAMTLIKVNSSCGLHFHISFENVINYYKLFNYEFVKFFQEKIKEKFTSEKEKERLSSRWCQFYRDESHFKSIKREQLKAFHKNERYYAINYNAYNLYKTVEFRIFPATNKVLTFTKYLKMVVNDIDSYLQNFKTIPVIKKIYTCKVKKRPDNVPIIIEEVLSIPTQINSGEIRNVQY
jgi:hypothetical protein